MSEFILKLRRAWQVQNSLLCVGLDPDWNRLPTGLSRDSRGAGEFCRQIVDATAPFVCAFKPQAAYFSARGDEAGLEQIIAYIQQRYPHIPVILDAKRGDIGATAALYAQEAFERYGADAVTVNPYLGGDALQPFLDYAHKGVIALCRTSNPGSGEVQQLMCDRESVARHVARRAAENWNANGNMGLVMGATYPDEIAAVRRIVGEMPLLIPGIGAQGGELRAAVENGLTAAGSGLLINASRSVIFAGSGDDFGQRAAAAASALKNRINRIRNGPA